MCQSINGLSKPAVTASLGYISQTGMPGLSDDERSRDGRLAARRFGHPFISW